MKIDKNLFEKINFEKDKDHLRKTMHNEETYRMLARLYANMVFEYTGKRTNLLRKNWKQETVDKWMKQAERFVDIIIDLGVLPEIYIKAQFEEFAPSLKRLGIPYLTFNYMLTSKAIERFHKWEDRIDKSHIAANDKIKAFHSRRFLDIESSINNSAEKYYLCLVNMKNHCEEDLTEEDALKELERIARAGFVSNVYIYSHPLVKKQGSFYLKSMATEAEKKLSDFQKVVVRKVRKELLFEQKDLAQYV